MRRLVIAVVAIMSVAVGVSATYAAGVLQVTPKVYPISCAAGTYFQTLNGRLSSSTNLRSWTAIGGVGPILNALAYSPTHHYLYGIEAAGTSNNILVQVNSRGSSSVLGLVAGLPAVYHYNGGDIDSATDTYYVSPGSTKLYAIDLATRTAAPVVVPARVSLGYDFVVQQGWLWSVTRGGLTGFSLTTGATKMFTIPTSDLGDEPGSMWSDLAGDGLSFRWDNTGKTFLATGLRSTSVTYTSVGTTNVQGKDNDGATCNAATSPGPDTAPVLQISGSSLVGLGPGKLLRVDLTLTNTYASPITVWPRVIKIALADSSASCPATTNFVVDQGVAVAFTVPASSTKTLAQLGVPPVDWPLFSMVDTAANQNACLGTTVTATYYVRYYG